MTMSHPQSYEILLVPAFADDRKTRSKGAAGTNDVTANDVGTDDSGANDSGTGDSGTDDSGTNDSGTNDSGAGDSTTATSEPQASGSRAVGSVGPGSAIRSAVVVATGETGETGYPRYAGDGMVADIDPETQTVEGLLIDGSELDYGLSARISERTTED